MGIAPVLRETPYGPSIGIVALLCLAAIALSRVLDRHRWLALILGAALGARLLVLGADEFFHIFPKRDAIGYHFRAATLAEAWWTGVAWENIDNFKTASYEIIIAPLYFWFGASPLLARVFNALLATVAAYNVYRIGKRVFDHRAGLVGAGVFALMPSLVRVHGEHLREALIILLVTQAIWLVVRDGWDVASVTVLAGCLAWLSIVRRPTFVVLLVPAALLAITSSQQSRKHALTAAVVLAGAVALAVAVLMALGRGNVLFQDWLDPSVLTQVRSAWATGGSAYLTGITFETWWHVIAFMPLGAIYFLFTPFPWQINNALALVASVENLLLFYPVALLALPAMRQALANRRQAALLSFLVVGALLYGLIEGNVGTALRHRAQFTWVIFLFAGKTIADWWASREEATPDLASEPDPAARAS